MFLITYIYDTLSEIYFANGDYEKVFEVYNNALSDCEILDDSSKYTFYNRIGRTFYYKGDEFIDEAIRWFILAIETKKDDNIFDLAGVYYMLSLCFMKKQDKKNAIVCINNAINRRNNNEFLKLKQQIMKILN
ncbi:MAG: hypothetical protein QM751_08165 [Paludibacteraceae bacterium]